MNKGRDVYSFLYNSEYNIANLKEIAEKIRNEKKVAIYAINIKNAVHSANCSSID